MTAFDLAALLIVAVSTLIGFSRGAVSELAAVVAFSVAAAIAVFLLPVSGPLLRHVVHPGWAGAAAAAIVVFLIAYVALRVLASAVTTRLRQTALGAIDRLIGGGFGLVRALVFLGVFALVFNAVTPRTFQPTWITGGPTWPVARTAGVLLAKIAPHGLKAAGGFGATMGEGVTRGFWASDGENTTVVDPADAESGGATPANTLSTVRPQTKAKPSPRSTGTAAPGYDTRNRRRLDNLVEQAR